MRAVQLVSPTVVRVVDVAEPVVGPDDVLIRVGGAGLCHSDLHVSHFPEEVFPLPMTLGHETAGTIVEVGERVTGWSAGDSAVVHLVWACGACPACSRGDDNVCHAAGRGAQPPTPGLGPDGGMAELMAVPARHLVSIADLDPVQAAPLSDAGMTSYHAIRNSRRTLRPDSTAVVIGVGGLGHLAVQILRATTGARIVGVDVGDAKLARARELGADVTITAHDTLADQLLELTGGRGPDTILDFVGNDATTDAAARAIGPDGIYQLVGIGGGAPRIVAEPRFGDVWPYGASVRTSYGGTRADLEACVALAASGRISVDVERHDLDDAVEVFARLERGEVDGRAVFVP